MPTDETFLSSGEVLAYLKVDLRTVYRLIKTGRLPAERVGRHWRFRKRDVDAWLAARLPAPGAVAISPPAGVERPSILLVDDEAGIRTLLSTMLAGAYDVHTAASGEAALERLRAPGTRCDLLIADLHMPGMDGLTLTREARHLRAALPVIIITGSSNPAAAIDAARLGIAGYLTKPFSAPQVLAAAARALGLSAA